MANNKVCIGGIDLDKSISVRLLDKNGHHETKEDCLYNILDIFEIEYLPHPRPLPHSEDIRVSSRIKIGEIQDLSMLDILHKNNVQIYFGNIRNNFDGKLNCTNSGSLYISEDVDGRVPKIVHVFGFAMRKSEEKITIVKSGTITMTELVNGVTIFLISDLKVILCKSFQKAH